MRSWASLGVVAVLLMFVADGTEARAGHAPAACQVYRSTLQTVRDALARGERDTALVALREAKRALLECHREEAGMTNLLAADDRPTSAV